jgi:tetratricopeptide (TPR) repeat protein
MPSHTWTRVGDWQHSIDANVAAGAAARREGSTAEELHTLDYRTYAYLQLGQDRAARRILDSLQFIAPRLDPNATGGAAPPAAGYFAIAAIPARYALERGAWAEAARLEPRPSPVPFANALTWFARALGASRTGDTVAAQAAIASLQGIRDRLLQAKEAYWSEQVEIQRQAAVAWLGFAMGRQDEALAGMRAAADREDATEKNAITPGPLAPARELLGEMLLQVGQPSAALKEFEASAVRDPNRFRNFYGAALAAERSGNAAKARQYFARLAQLGAKGDARPELQRARTFIAAK